MNKQDSLVTFKAPGTRGQAKQLGFMSENALDGRSFGTLGFDGLKFVQDSGKRYDRAYRKFLRGYILDGLGAVAIGANPRVVTDFDPEFDWDERVAAGRYDGVYISSSFDPKVNLPVGGVFTGVLESEVLLNQRTGNTTTQGWVDHIAGLKPEQDFIHPFTLLQIGEDEPERQRTQWMLTIWKDASGRFWYAILDVGYGDRRLVVSPVGAGGGFDSDDLGASSVRKSLAA